jgi:hypothetical protein
MKDFLFGLPWFLGLGFRLVALGPPGPKLRALVRLKTGVKR